MVSPLRVLHYAALRHHRLYGRPDVHGARVIFESVSQSHTGTEDCCFTDSCTEAGLGRTYQQSIYSHVDCRSPVYRSVRSTRSSSNSSGGKSIDRRRPLTVITFTLTFFLLSVRKRLCDLSLRSLPAGCREAANCRY